MHKCDFTQAVEFLEIQKRKNLGTYQQTYISKNVNTFSDTSLTITSVQPLENPKLFQFLQSRKIDLHIARAYCKEIHYQTGGRNYFAIGFSNNMGGYELRNPQFKGCLPPKEITTFDKKTPIVNLFEGFMGYLSLLTMQAKQADISAVVLNSVANLEKAIPFLSKHTQINAFLDNDEAGKRALEKLQKLNLSVVDISKRYADFKDVNDFLCRKKMEKIILKTSQKSLKTEVSKDEKQQLQTMREHFKFLSKQVCVSECPKPCFSSRWSNKLLKKHALK